MVCEFYCCSKIHFLLHVAFFPKTLKFSAYVGQSQELRTHLLSYWVTKIMLNFRIEESLKYIATHERWKANIEWKERGAQKWNKILFLFLKKVIDENILMHESNLMTRILFWANIFFSKKIFHDISIFRDCYWNLCFNTSLV